jgi:hypothetical protein
MGKMSSGVRVSPDVAAAWAGVAEAPGGPWLACGFDPADKTLVTVRESGAGGYAAAAPSLPEDDITFLVCPFQLDGRCVNVCVC